MKLTDAQQTMLKNWVDEGYSLAELQKTINEEFQLSLTFMDVRFLVLDLGLTIQDRSDSQGAVDLTKIPQPKADQTADANDAPLGSGRVSVTLDRVVQSGAVVSGEVTFSDGIHASWMFDQMGRLSLTAPEPGYRPGQEDLQAFQAELARILQSQGM